MRPRRPIHRTRSCAARGFTLVEVAIAIVITSVAIGAVQAMLAASTRVTAVNDELQSAGMLARALQERCLEMDRAALLALNGTSYAPPVDSRGNAIADLSNYKQTVAVQRVDPASINQTSTDPDAGLLRVVVSVFRRDKLVCQSSRLLATTRQD